MKNNKIYGLIILFAVALMGCIKDPVIVDPPDPVEEDKVNFSFRLTGVLGANSFMMNDTFRNSSGYNCKISILKFYISDIDLIREDGTFERVADVALFDFNDNHGFNGRGYEEKSYYVTPGVYKGVRFGIGLSKDLNQEDPTNYTINEDLGAQDMYWGWASGYRFLKLEGKYDTTKFSTANILEPFVYHTGTDSLFREIAFTDDFFTVLEDDVKIYDIELSMAKVFYGAEVIDLRKEDFSHTLGSADVFDIARKITDNFKTTFER